MPAERLTMRVSSSLGVELQALHDAEAVAQRRGQQAGARGRADQRERRQVELDRARRRPLADHDVDLVVLQRRVQDLLDDRAQAVDLVDEQHVVRLEVGQHRGQVAGPLEHRTRGLAQVDAQLVGDDVRQRGLAQAGRAEDQHVVERLAALARGRDEDLHLLAHRRLADVLGQRLGPDGTVDGDVFVGGLGGDQAVGVLHRLIMGYAGRRFDRKKGQSAGKRTCEGPVSRGQPWKRPAPQCPGADTATRRNRRNCPLSRHADGPANTTRPCR